MTVNTKTEQNRIKSAGYAAQRAFIGLLDLVYPPGLYCICCGKITDDSRTYGMCNDCMNSVKWINGKTCTKCGKALGDNDPFDICYSCREYSHNFDRGYSCTEYGMHEKNLIYELKYASRGEVANYIGEIMYDMMSARIGDDELACSYDIVTCIPIYNQRKQTRGFNQAALITESFARRSHLTADTELIVRTRATRPMKGLGAAERKANIQGAFSIRPRKAENVAGKRILLIDDIATTLATIDEAALVLKKAGALTVDFATFASGADVII